MPTAWILQLSVLSLCLIQTQFDSSETWVYQMELNTCTVEPVKNGRSQGQADRQVFRGVWFIQVRRFAENAIELRHSYTLGL